MLPKVIAELHVDADSVANPAVIKIDWLNWGKAEENSITTFSWKAQPTITLYFLKVSHLLLTRNQFACNQAY